MIAAWALRGDDNPVCLTAETMRASCGHACKAIMLIVGAVSSCGLALAEPAYPARPVRLIVPFVHATGTDVLARAIGARLTHSWQQPVVVDNRPGDGGWNGSRLAVTALPDGHTLLLANVAALAYSPAMRSGEAFDPARDLAPVTQLTATANVMLAQPAVGAVTVAQLIAAARAQPGALRFASGGAGTAGHLAGELLRSMARIELVHVPYAGSPAAMSAMLMGEAQISFTSLLSSLPHVKSGRLRALAVTSLSRARVLPEVPTLDESGVTGFEVSGWQGVLAPAGTPWAIRQQLHAAVAEVLRAAEIAAQLEASGLDVVASTPDAFGRYLKTETTKWGALIRRLGLRAGGPGRSIAAWSRKPRHAPVSHAGAAPSA